MTPPGTSRLVGPRSHIPKLSKVAAIKSRHPQSSVILILRSAQT